ncbi:hypothetical protein GGR21_001499 [Dysgonomonas hofstadii]|uniref:Uncharacterized protein n=1 Tax=Dysgonomonas hofstadii TaxID=637886 RepID=A0A840CJR3_9BACT|nr:hypothetical protein [Dysgonomonas hofstadii]
MMNIKEIDSEPYSLTTIITFGIYVICYMIIKTTIS